MKQLKEQQTRFAPKDRRLEQVERAEQLARRDRGQRSSIPTSTLCFRITGYRPDGWPALVLDGGDVQHDLRLFVEDLSATVRQTVEQAAEPVLTVDEVSRRFNVSTRTVTRWRRQGLVARRFVIDGRTKVGFLESSLSRFVDDASRPGRTGVTVPATDRRGAGRDRPPRPSHGAGRPGRSAWSRSRGGSHARWDAPPKPSGTTLKAYDREHPDRAIFPPSTGPLDDEAKGQIYRRYRRASRSRCWPPSSAGPGRASTA